jgi:hypothetical protein
LKKLIVGNDAKRREIGSFYNRFSGSLKDLKNLKKLKFLDIESTDINSGLEYLPGTLKKFLCNGKLEVPLKNYFMNDENRVYYDYSVWRKNNLDLIKQIQMNEKLMIIFKIVKNILG